jgi:hypothetical protein
MNISGQKHYPAWTNHFVPKAPLFQPHQYSQILFSDFGIFLWLGTLVWWSMQRGFAEMFRVYFVPYLWVNHWLILITFLQVSSFAQHLNCIVLTLLVSTPILSFLIIASLHLRSPAVRFPQWTGISLVERDSLPLSRGG